MKFRRKYEPVKPSDLDEHLGLALDGATPPEWVQRFYKREIPSLLPAEPMALEVKARKALDKWEQEMRRAYFENGEGNLNDLRYNCEMAELVNAYLEGGIVLKDGSLLVPNPRAKAQFGRNEHGHAYLTFGMIHELSGLRVQLKWVDDAVPHEAKVTAVCFDLGKRIKKARPEFDFSDATIKVTKPNLGPHDIDRKTGTRYGRPHRPNRNRLCEADLISA